MYYFYMGSVLLPISPESFSLKIKNTNKTLTLINEGEINILRDAGLTELDFKVLIPAVQYSFAKYDGGFKRPSYFLNHFEKLKTSKQPFQFIVSRITPDGKMLFDTNMKVALEDYKVDEKSKEGFDLTVSISLKQYKYYGTKVVKVIETATNTTKEPAKNTLASPDQKAITFEKLREQENSPEPKRPTTYTVQEGDSLLTIVRKFYGVDSLYYSVYKANYDTFKNGSASVKAGMTLILPTVEELSKLDLTQPDGGGHFTSSGTFVSGAGGKF